MGFWPDIHQPFAVGPTGPPLCLCPTPGNGGAIGDFDNKDSDLSTRCALRVDPSLIHPTPPEAPTCSNLTQPHTPSDDSTLTGHLLQLQHSHSPFEIIQSEWAASDPANCGYDPSRAPRTTSPPPQIIGCSYVAANAVSARKGGLSTASSSGSRSWASSSAKRRRSVPRIIVTVL